MKPTTFSGTAMLVWLAAASAQAQSPNEAQQVAAAVEKTLQRHAGDVHTCFAKALADRLDVAGKLELEVTVAAGGRVKEVEVASKAPGVTDGLAACVQAAVTNWKVEDIEAGSAVVLPFQFAGQANQFVVNAEDAPLRGPQPKAKVRPPFQVKILADALNVRAQQIAVTHLTVAPANRVAMHRHPQSSKILHVLKGSMRVLGPSGQDPIKLVEGDTVFLPAGYPHVIENMGRQLPVELLQVFSPPGPETVYRDPADAGGRAAFEVLRGPAPKPTDGATPVVVRRDERKAGSAFAGKGTATVLLEGERTGGAAPGLSLVQFQAGAAVPRQVHEKSETFMWVMSGGGVLKVGNEDYPFAAGQALFLPRNQPYSLTLARNQATVALELFGLAGPELRHKTNAAPSALPASKNVGAPGAVKPASKL